MTAPSQPVTIYHNPRCSKSRRALALLHEHGIEPRVVEYLETPPDADELDMLLRALELEPQALTRREEPQYHDAGLDDPRLTRRERIERMVRYPGVIQRPIVRAGDRARIGRPPDAILEIL